MFVFVILRPGRDGGHVPAGVADSEYDAYGIVYDAVLRDPSLEPADFVIYQTALNRPMQWFPIAPMPPGWRPRPAASPNRHVPPANAHIPYGWYW